MVVSADVYGVVFRSGAFEYVLGLDDQTLVWCENRRGTRRRREDRLRAQAGVVELVAREFWYREAYVQAAWAWQASRLDRLTYPAVPKFDPVRVLSRPNRFEISYHGDGSVALPEFDPDLRSCDQLRVRLRVVLDGICRLQAEAVEIVDALDAQLG